MLLFQVNIRHFLRFAFCSVNFLFSSVFKLLLGPLLVLRSVYSFSCEIMLRFLFAIKGFNKLHVEWKNMEGCILLKLR